MSSSAHSHSGGLVSSKPEGRGPSTGFAGADILWGSRPTSGRSAGDLRCYVACEGGRPFAAQRVVQLIPENLRRGPEGLDQRFPKSGPDQIQRRVFLPKNVFAADVPPALQHSRVEATKIHGE